MVRYATLLRGATVESIPMYMYKKDCHKKRKIPKAVRNNSGSFNVDLSDTTQKNVKQARKDAGVKRKRRN